MGRYLLKRLMLIVPTLLGIILINFVVVQFAPGGPIEQIIAQLAFEQTSTTSGISGGGDAGNLNSVSGNYTIPPEIIADLERQFGFDKPPYVRFFNMLVNTLPTIKEFFRNKILIFPRLNP